ncbi:unnamed protein product [Diplocarpon coronariae]
MQMAAEGQKGACWLMSSPKAFHDEDGARLARAGSDGGYRSDLGCHPDLIIPTISHISANERPVAGAWSASPHSCAHLPSVQLASIRPGRPALPGDDATKPLYILESEISRLRSSVSSALLCPALLCPPLPSSALLRSAPLPPGPTTLSSSPSPAEQLFASQGAPQSLRSLSKRFPVVSQAGHLDLSPRICAAPGINQGWPISHAAVQLGCSRLQAATDGEAGLHNLLSWVSATGLECPGQSCRREEAMPGDSLLANRSWIMPRPQVDRRVVSLVPAMESSPS